MKHLFRLSVLSGLFYAAMLGAAENYQGVWHGELVEMVVAGEQYEQYGVTLTISAHEYRIDYDSLDCAGVLHLQKQRGRFYRFRDELNYGLRRCESGGHTQIHFINSQRAAFQWFDKKGVLKVEGYLKRQAQLMT
jgi:hypothetical protein